MELRITLRTNRYFQNWPIWNLPHYSHSKEICRCLYLYKLLNYNNFLPFGSIMNYINWESLKHQQHTTNIRIHLYFRYSTEWEELLHREMYAKCWYFITCVTTNFICMPIPSECVHVWVQPRSNSAHSEYDESTTHTGVPCL